MSKLNKKVFEERNTETGITIHFVNEDYDDGAIIFQAKCSINKYDSVKEIANKIIIAKLILLTQSPN